MQPISVDDEWQSLSEKDDRTSPAEYPDMCLISRDELGEIIARVVLEKRKTNAKDLIPIVKAAIKLEERNPAYETFDALAERQAQVAVDLILGGTD